MVLIRQNILGLFFSYFTINLNTAGNAAIPFGTDLIYVIQGVFYYFVLNV